MVQLLYNGWKNISAWTQNYYKNVLQFENFRPHWTRLKNREDHLICCFLLNSSAFTHGTGRNIVLLKP